MPSSEMLGVSIEGRFADRRGWNKRSNSYKHIERVGAGYGRVPWVSQPIPIVLQSGGAKLGEWTVASRRLIYGEWGIRIGEALRTAYGKYKAERLMDKKETMRKLAFTCPVCGKKTDRSVDELKEGAHVVCPFCNLKLILHGHMWEEVKGELEKLDSRGG